MNAFGTSFNIFCQSVNPDFFFFGGGGGVVLKHSYHYYENNMDEMMLIINQIITRGTDKCIQITNCKA